MNKSSTFAVLLAISVALVFAEQSKVNDKAVKNQREFIKRGFRCGTPTPPEAQRTEDRARLSALRFEGFNAEEKTKTADTQIPIYFHVIQDDNGQGDVPDSKLDEQIDVLNKAYEKFHFRFNRAGVDRTRNGRWFRMGIDSPEETEAKSALGKEEQTHLNFYTANIGGDLLGWATFPFNLAGAPSMDGVVILNTSFPGGAKHPYNMGMTAVHEIGHWLGLYHTFQGGCTPPGDEVDDTPGESSPAEGPCAANANRDTCPAPGKDDIKNFMDYTDDDCMDHFSNGQSSRMHLQVASYRTNLVPSNVRTLFILPP